MEIFLIKAAQLIAALALLVTVHEFGHYIFARIFGIKVEKFFLFFNPRFSLLRYVPEEGRLELCTWMTKDDKPCPLASFKVGRAYLPGEKVPGWKQTIYGIGWIPLGGYCSIAGMVDETKSADDVAQSPSETDFYTKPAWQRLLVMAGGVIFNFIMAVVIYICLTWSYGEKEVRFRDAYAGMDFVPAAIEAGFRAGDIPLMADGQPVEASDPNVMVTMLQAHDITVLRNGRDSVNIVLPKDFVLNCSDERGFFAYRTPVVVAKSMAGTPAEEMGLLPGDRIVAVGDSLTPSITELFPVLMVYAGQTVPIQVERQGQTLTLQGTPDEGGKLGIQLTPLTDIYPVFTHEYTLLQSIPRGWEVGSSTLTNYVKSLSQVFSARGAKQIGGFGALGDMFPEQWNWFSFWSLTAFLSVVLAFMNILPIPVLDGGHIIFLLVEMVIRRRVPLKLIEIASTIGFWLLLALMLFANMNDVIRFLS